MVPLFRYWSLVGCVVLSACTGRDDGKHVFQSSPPAPVAPAAVQPAQSMPEPPIGSGGPTARIASVRLASTGQPASLSEIAESFQVIVLVTQAAGSGAQEPGARIELRFTGERDTTFIAHVAAPVPSVIAHEFLVRAGATRSGLGDGSYQAQVRFIGAAGRAIATSLPVSLTVRHR